MCLMGPVAVDARQTQMTLKTFHLPRFYVLCAALTEKTNWIT